MSSDVLESLCHPFNEFAHTPLCVAVDVSTAHGTLRRTLGVRLRGGTTTRVAVLATVLLINASCNRTRHYTANATNDAALWWMYVPLIEPFDLVEERLRAVGCSILIPGSVKVGSLCVCEYIHRPIRWGCMSAIASVRNSTLCAKMKTLQHTDLMNGTRRSC